MGSSPAWVTSGGFLSQHRVYSVSQINRCIKANIQINSWLPILECLFLDILDSHKDCMDILTCYRCSCIVLFLDYLLFWLPLIHPLYLSHCFQSSLLPLRCLVHLKSTNTTSRSNVIILYLQYSLQDCYFYAAVYPRLLYSTINCHINPPTTAPIKAPIRVTNLSKCWYTCQGISREIEHCQTSRAVSTFTGRPFLTGKSIILHCWGWSKLQ